MTKLLRFFKWWTWILCVLVVGVIVFQVDLEMKLIKKMGEIISLIQSGFATKSGLWDVGTSMILIALGICVCAVLVNFLASTVSAYFSRTLRSNVFRKVNSFSMEEMNKFSVASLITRTTNDIKQVEQTVFVTLRMAITAPVMGAYAIKEIVGSSLTLTWTTAGAVALLFALVLFLFFVAVPRFTTIQKKTDKLNNVTRENLTGIRVVRAYNAEQEQEQKFEGVNKDLTKTQLFVNRVMALLWPGMDFIMNALSVAIYFIGAYLIDGGNLLYADMAIKMLPMNN